MSMTEIRYLKRQIATKKREGKIIMLCRHPRSDPKKTMTMGPIRHDDLYLENMKATGLRMTRQQKRAFEKIQKKKKIK